MLEELADPVGLSPARHRVRPQTHLVPETLRKGFELGACEVFDAGLQRADARRPNARFQYRSAAATPEMTPHLLPTPIGDEDECVVECKGCGDAMIGGKGEGERPKQSATSLPKGSGALSLWMRHDVNVDVDGWVGSQR